MARPSSASQPPLWSSWDGQTYGKHFHGREITLFAMPKRAGPSTTYRNDYPEPPLFWKHATKPDHSKRPVGEFGHTTSHRSDFPQHKIGGGTPAIKAYPEQRYHPKLSSVTTARDSFQQPKLPPARPRTAQQPYTTLDIPMGSTTMRSDYIQWKIPERKPSRWPQTRWLSPLRLPRHALSLMGPRSRLASSQATASTCRSTRSRPNSTAKPPHAKTSAGLPRSSRRPPCTR